MESELRFKPGDEVVCVSPVDPYLYEGRVYSITSFSTFGLLCLEGVDGAWDTERFELLKPPVAPKLTGGSSDYYKLPPDATDIMDLIEHKEMSFALGNIFKAVYRLGDKPGTTQKYDLEKIIYFANRELERLNDR